jgi:hypothetical protein
MIYNNFMDITWEYNGKTHQLDPCCLVPKEKDSTNMIPLYQLLSMPESDAVAISNAWRLKQIRNHRDQLIAATDWWMMSDRTATTEQIAYRKALRDITNQSDLNNIVWPTPPEN